MKAHVPVALRDEVGQRIHTHKKKIEKCAACNLQESGVHTFFLRRRIVGGGSLAEFVDITRWTWRTAPRDLGCNSH